MHCFQLHSNQRFHLLLALLNFQFQFALQLVVRFLLATLTFALLVIVALKHFSIGLLFLSKLKPGLFGIV